MRRRVNGGFGAAVNSGAREATGDHLLILNSDLDVPSDLVPSLSQVAETTPQAVIAPKILDHQGRVTYSARRWPTLLNQSIEWLTPLARWRDRPWMRLLLGHDNRVLRAVGDMEVDWLVGAAFMVPTAEFRAVGGLDERFHMNSEEIDLQRRLAERGVKRVYVPSISVIHEGGGSSDPAKRRRWLVTSQLRYAEKWGGLRRLRVALTVATFINFAWNSIRRLRGIDVQPLNVAREELRLIWSPT